MENENKNPQPQQDDSWLDDMLGIKTPAPELTADEMATSAAGLVHMEDMDLEKILAEDWSKVPDLETVRQAQAEGVEPEALVSAQSPKPQTPPAPAVSDDTAVFRVSDDTVVVAVPQGDKTPRQPRQDATQKFTPAQLEATQVVGAAPVQEDGQTPEKKKTDKAKASRKTSKKAAKNASPDDPKGRPERKKGYGLMALPQIVCTVVLLFILVFIGSNTGNILWEAVADLMAFGKPDVQMEITIGENDSIESIAQRLAEGGLIKYPDLFTKFATLTGKDERIDPGTYTLTAKYDYNAMLKNMVDYGPVRNEITVMIPEGYTCAQIFQLLESKGVCSAAELEAYAAEGELRDYWFLEDLPRGSKYCLEGYLFPDTYDFYTNDTPRHALEKMLSGFDSRFTDKLKNKLDPLNEQIAATLRKRGYDNNFIQSRLLTYHDIVIIASMIEKETANNDESYTISSVLFNRLTNPGNYPYLNIDATLIYALDGNIDPETGKVKPLTNQDYQMDHPYNTYKEPGLPPGPISNPGAYSLDAALTPDSTSYYFYVYNPQTRVHIFAKTQSEHNKNIKYVQSLG